MDLDSFEKAILVVGSDQEYKTYAAKALALHPKPVSQTLGGEIYGRSLREASSVVNTTPLEINKKTKFREIVVNTSPFPEPFQEEQGIHDVHEHMREFAPWWIRWNSLQELDGKQMAVVCVINAALPGQSSGTHLPDWLGLLRYIFHPARVPITFLVFKPHGSADTMEKERAREIVLQNLAKQRFRNLSDVMLQYGALGVGAKLEIPTMRFFDYSEVVRLHGPWAPVKVILFGRTGSGKSTLAQMLTKGSLDPGAATFAASSSARGKTDRVEHGFNAKWLVVDTPGLGESRDELATIDTSTAVMKIYQDIEKNHGVFTHYIYVCKQDRHDMLEEDTWNLFLRLFGEKIAKNFTVVITDSTPQWIEKHVEQLRKQFKLCNHFLSVQFPPVDATDEELEEENQEGRLTSLRELEDAFTKQNRNEVFGKYGGTSKTALGIEIAHIRNVKNCETTFTGRAVASTAKRVLKISGYGLQVWQDLREESHTERARKDILGQESNFDY